MSPLGAQLRHVLARRPGRYFVSPRAHAGVWWNLQFPLVDSVEDQVVHPPQICVPAADTAAAQDRPLSFSLSPQADPPLCSHRLPVAVLQRRPTVSPVEHRPQPVQEAVPVCTASQRAGHSRAYVPPFGRLAAGLRLPLVPPHESLPPRLSYAQTGDRGRPRMPDTLHPRATFVPPSLHPCCILAPGLLRTCQLRINQSASHYFDAGQVTHAAALSQ